ncbi:MAG: hypothetical protein NTU41_12225, partial [Chloroflexi bacterium]|nr:hypothetical protein [Chloroflexota bacterium]
MRVTVKKRSESGRRITVRRIAGVAIILALLISSVALVLGSVSSALAGTSTGSQDRQLVEVVVNGKPPASTASVNGVTVTGSQTGSSVLSNVPAFDWSYGCSATAAAMLFGYYDINGYANMYTGATNGGVCPLDNSVWGQTAYRSVTCYECPLSATHLGVDGRITKGSVDDYWINYLNAGPDPYIGRWTEHTQGDCTADFMGTSQSKFSNSDGATTFWFYSNGDPLYDYTGSEPNRRDGCHGLRLFAESRGYYVTADFSQYIQGYATDPTKGFTFADYMAEIDAGRPVIIQVRGHSMLGYGYNTTGNTVYIHDTWDYSDHSMTWGGSYEGLQHYGVTVLRLASADQPTVSLGEAVDNAGLSWSTGGNANWSAETTTTYYGGAAARSGTITHNQSSWLRTTVTGAGALTFYWKVSSEKNYDFLRFYIDGVEQVRISGAIDWQQKSYSVASGTHILEWRYTKDRSMSSGSDCGWLDKVVFTAAGPPSPAIGCSPSSFTFTATQGGANPASQTLSIQNAGTGTLNWSVSDDADWLVLTPASGSSTGETDTVSVVANIAGVSIGSHSATITISDPGATNSPRIVSVTLTISAPSPTIGCSPSSFTFTATQGGTDPASQTLSIRNTGT